MPDTPSRRVDEGREIAMRWMKRYRALPRWARSLIWIHTLLLLALLGIVLLVNHARRDIVRIYLSHATPVAMRAEDAAQKNVFFRGFTWDKTLGPLLLFEQAIDDERLYLEWSPRKDGVVSVSPDRAQLDALRVRLGSRLRTITVNNQPVTFNVSLTVRGGVILWIKGEVITGYTRFPSNGVRTIRVPNANGNSDGYVWFGRASTANPPEETDRQTESQPTRWFYDLSTQSWRERDSD